MIGAFLLGQIPLILEEVARGGGGGSGGGGSSGGSGGGGGLLYLIGLIGYIPMHFLSAFLRKKWYGKEGWLAARIAGWVIAGVVVILAFTLIPLINTTLHSLLFAFYISVPIAIGALLGMSAGLHAWFPKIGRNAKMQKAVAAAASKDYVWNQKNLLQYVDGIFYKFQQDWTNFDTESMKTYLSPNYQNHITLMMYALKGAHRVNKVMSPQILSREIIVVNDSDNNDEDSFEIAIMAVANDQLYDDRTNALLFQDKSTFTEYWRFIRRGNNWLFDGIRQETQDVFKTSYAIAQFANQNGLYYSADWGWLLLPADGYLFNHGKFGTSDINNHVIGFVNAVLTQLYTYTPSPNKQGTFTTAIDQYLVVQTNVPKTYGRILVRRRSKFINWPVKGLTQVKMEWGEFNKMYDVYASDLERVTSFELLNPAFMAVLRDLPCEVNIEVVDNVVYLFTKAKTDVNTYKVLYDVVLKAHKEMKL